MDEILKAIRELGDEQRALRDEVRRLGEKIAELRNENRPRFKTNEQLWDEYRKERGLPVAEKIAPA